LSRTSLIPWGWDDDWELELKDYPEDDPIVGRVTAVFRDQYLVRCAEREVRAEISGKLQFGAKAPPDYPCAGDWVVLKDTQGELCIIEYLIPRKNFLSRKSAGTGGQEQSLAANVDIVFIVSDFENDFNLWRIERYLALARAENIRPIVLLNKSDLAPHPEVCVKKVKEIFPDGLVYTLSAVKREGLEVIHQNLEGDRTGIFLGSSGVGKSTLLNALTGSEIQKTSPVQARDGQGVHTTSHRQIFALPQGGLIIDTPGLREIQPWKDATELAGVFEDIDLLAAQCKFGDCRHDSEPGCAVKEALGKGLLAAGRFESYLRLQRDVEALKSKQDPSMRPDTKKGRENIERAKKQNPERKKI